MLADLAGRLAAFFRAARPTPRFGEPAVLSANVDENFAQVEPFVGNVVDRRSHDDIRAFQLGELQTKRERFATRVRDGRIREGHGDLRLEHVYFLPDRGPVVIDCIEFNASFRCGDAAGDAAFLAMELEAARRPDLASGFLARFAEESDDFGLYGALDFYLSYRAFVRGKVAVFLTADGAAPDELRARKREEARRDFGIARSFGGAPVDPAFIVVVGGVVGSGKSTLAAGLRRELAAPVISSDRAQGAGRIGPDRTWPRRPLRTGRNRPDLRRGPAPRRRSPRREPQRDSGRDALRASLAYRGADLAHATGARFVLVESRCPDRQLLRSRLAARARGASVSDATAAELDELLGRYEPVTSADPEPRLSIDTAVALERALFELRAAGVLPARERRLS